MNVGLHCERPRQPDPLALSAAERPRPAAGQLRRQPDQGEQLPGLRLDLARRHHAVEAQDLRQRLAHRKARVERRVRVLEDHLHVAAQILQLAAARAREVSPHEPDAAVLRLVQAQQRAAERGLATAALADQTERLVPPDGEADAVDRRTLGAGARRRIWATLRRLEKATVSSSTSTSGPLSACRRVTEPVPRSARDTGRRSHALVRPPAGGPASWRSRRSRNGSARRTGSPAAGRPGWAAGRGSVRAAGRDRPNAGIEDKRPSV